jgi:hypothetical protein
MEKVMRNNNNALLGALGCLGLLGLLAAPGAVLAAEPGTYGIQISGTVPPITILPTPSVVTLENANFTPSTGVATIDELIDAAGHLKTANVVLKFEGVTTNYPAKVAFTSTNNGLKSGSAVISYGATAQVAGEPLAVECIFGAGGPANCISSDAAVKLNEVSIEVGITTEIPENVGDTVITAGTYSDTLVFKVGATL